MCFYLSCSKTVLNKHLRTLYFVIIYLLEINKCHNYVPNDITCQVLVSVWRSKVEHTNVVSVAGGGLPFRCLLCGRAYKRRDNLTRHQRYECLTSEPQFLCTICPYKAKQKVHLKSHMAIRHGKFISNKQ